MRTTVIPAQITTVEDTIAGNFTLTQILILMVPVFWTAIVYTLFFPVMHLSFYKLPLIAGVLIACLILSLRIHGKVVLNWLIILITYNLRAKYYVFEKNDSYLRNLHLPEFKKKRVNIFQSKPVQKESERIIPGFSLGKVMQFEYFLRNSLLRISYKSAKKGGVHVAFEQIKK